MERDAAKALLERLFQIGLSAASPELRLAPYLDALPGGALTVLAAGKAAVGMAQAVERRWSGPLKGLVVTRHGEGRPIPRLEVIEAAHPTPDASSLAAAQRILAIADAAGEGDQLLMMLSGGASSLLCLPGDGLTPTIKTIAYSRPPAFWRAGGGDQHRSTPPLGYQGRTSRCSGLSSAAHNPSYL